MSKTGKLGLVGPVEIPIIKSSFDAFEKGAKLLKPDVAVSVTWTGDENDAGKGKQQAQALLDQGVDVIMHNANQAGLGVFQAVEGKPGAMVIGANADQSALATKQNLGSFILDVPNAMLSVAKIVQEGKGEGKPIPAGLKENAVYFKYNLGFAGTIPADLKAKAEQAKADIIAGKVSP
jgi:basic membrane protein A